MDTLLISFSSLSAKVLFFTVSFAFCSVNPIFWKRSICPDITLVKCKYFRWKFLCWGNLFVKQQKILEKLNIQLHFLYILFVCFFTPFFVRLHQPSVQATVFNFRFCSTFHHFRFLYSYTDLYINWLDRTTYLKRHQILTPSSPLLSEGPFLSKSVKRSR